MESSDRQKSYRDSLRKLKQSRKNKRFTWLLAVLTFTLPINVVLQAQPSLAQVTAQIPSLDKNIVYVNPKTGDDSQTGEKFDPFKTITQALKVATSGSTIKLASGTYSQETGETFPLVIQDKITLKGNADNQGYDTVIQGSGYFISPTGAGQNVAIAALKDAAGITGVTVTNIQSRGHGLWLESSSPKIVSNTFTRNGNTGVSVNGNSSPVIANNYFYNNSGNGLLIYGTSQPQVMDNTFKNTGFGVSVVQNAAPTLTKNSFDGNRIGIILEGNSQAVLRDNEIVNSEDSGLTAIADSQVDLGTSSEPGNNTFRSNRKLDIQNASKNEIVAVGTQTSGQTDGDINFDSGEFVALSNSTQKSSPLPPLPSQDKPSVAQLDLPAPAPVSTPAPIPIPTIDTTANPSLPAPPPVSEPSTGNKELVFTASSSSSVPTIETAQPQPVPFPPTISSSSINPVKYKVLVEALDSNEENEVRSLYPEAFETVFEGQSVLQIGAFNNRDKAKQAERSLAKLGLATYFLE